MVARPICFVFERQEVLRAASRACANTGKSMAARMAIMAMTTSSSMSVNAECDLRFIFILLWRIPTARARRRRWISFAYGKALSRSHEAPARLRYAGTPGSGFLFDPPVRAVLGETLCKHRLASYGRRTARRFDRDPQAGRSRPGTRTRPCSTSSTGRAADQCCEEARTTSCGDSTHVWIGSEQI